MKFKLSSSPFENCTFKKFGKGYPILLIHGFGEDGNVWDKVYPQLMADYMVIIPDLPGSGDSPLPKNILSMELLAEFIVALLNEEGIERTILFGHSMGGYASLAFANAYPERLDGLSLVHSSSFADDAEKVVNRQKAIKLIENGGREAFLQVMIPNLYSHHSIANNPNLINNHLTMANSLSSESLVSYYEAMIQRKDRTNVFMQTNMLFQFVIGTEDKAIPFEQSLKQCHFPENVRVDILKEVGHMLMVEQPDVCASILNSFCKYVHEGKKALNL